ncbi:MAG: Coenzyme F420 hydrogenase/dehydrogenase, beta subunit C-terminal domain, partial [Bacteroidaceae bacterium]|nr:Coenzyme F420 hydrogenase/dehydrogenase, beta subunit C-terminal domain [Bacteroidaceae bacterium]
SDIMYYDQSSKLVKILLPRQKNLYMKTYLSEIISRPSCYNCPVKGGRSCADITLADFWGIENVEPTVNDDKGTSMVLVHTVKGLASLPLENLNFKETNQSVLKYNTSYIKSSTANPKRENFFSALETTDDLHQLMEDTLRPTIKEQIETLKHPLYLSKRMVKMIIKPVLNTAPRPSGGGVFV